MDWAAYKQIYFIWFWRLESPKFRVLTHLISGKDSLPGSDDCLFAVFSHGGEEWALVSFSSKKNSPKKNKIKYKQINKNTVLSWGLYPHDLIWAYLAPKDSPPRTIALGIRASTHDFGGGTNRDTVHQSQWGGRVRPYRSWGSRLWVWIQSTIRICLRVLNRHEAQLNQLYI